MLRAIYEQEGRTEVRSGSSVANSAMSRPAAGFRLSRGDVCATGSSVPQSGVSGLVSECLVEQLEPFLVGAYELVAVLSLRQPSPAAFPYRQVLQHGAPGTVGHGLRTWHSVGRFRHGAQPAVAEERFR